MEVENYAIDEIAFVQVKSVANQAVLNKSVREYSRRGDRYARMFFAVHSPSSPIKSPIDSTVKVWEGQRIADLVARTGLGEWVESRLA